MEPCNKSRLKTLGSWFSFEPSTCLKVKDSSLLLVCCFLLLLSVIYQKGIGLVVSTMATKMKGIYKGFKYISQIFVVKEREMEIGYPTDVKHVAHIGWDGPSSSGSGSGSGSGSAPSWMNEFKTAPDFSATSLATIGEPRDSNSNGLSTWSSQDFEQSMGRRTASEMFKDFPPTDIPTVPKKHKRKKTRSTSSPKSSSSSRSSRAAKSKATHIGMEATAELQA